MVIALVCAHLHQRPLQRGHCRTAQQQHRGLFRRILLGSEKVVPSSGSASSDLALSGFGQLGNGTLYCSLALECRVDIDGVGLDALPNAGLAMVFQEQECFGTGTAWFIRGSDTFQTSVMPDAQSMSAHCE